jgi:histidinol-phosphate aminotransferase
MRGAPISHAPDFEVALSLGEANNQKKRAMKTTTFSRRRFVGGVAVALGYAGLRSGGRAWAQSADQVIRSAGGRVSADQYDALAKLCFNENPYGPPESVLKAMTAAVKYANRYGYPDGGIVQAIAAHHGVQPENVLLGAGSTEILEVTGSTFLQGGKKVIGVEPTFGTVYEHATGIKASAVRLPLRPDYRQDIPAMVQAAKDNHPDIGFVYLCNPNNPTGVVVTKDEVRQLLDGIPRNVPVLIDEAYHHFVEDPAYATSVPYVLEGRPVIVARTFSKIAALAGMRLGYGIAPSNLIEQMRAYSDSFSVNVLVKWGGLAALKDTAAQQRVRSDILQTRKRVTSELDSLGYKVIPSEANFFMVNIQREVRSVIQAFRQRGILVGRPFPPMLEHLRVSVGMPDEMNRFMAAFKEIIVAKTASK